MKLETFFKKFDLLAEAPGGVAKLRELVLDLAVQGRLSKREAGDAPVDELCEGLARARRLRIKAGEVRGRPDAHADEVAGRPIATPSHWAWLRLNQIGELSGGMTPSKGKSVYWDGDVNWFSPKDIKSNELVESELKITHEGVVATGLQVYRPRCLFMVARSGILKRTFPVAINRTEATVNQDLKVLAPFLPGMDRYLQIMFRGLTRFILSSLVKTGTTVQSLKYEDFEVQPFPIPPLAEQQRIVSKVDELMALCDRLEAQQQERETRRATLTQASLARFAEAPTPTNLNFLFHEAFATEPADFRECILTLAIRGRLVIQDSNDEPADHALAVALLARREQPVSLRIKEPSPIQVGEEHKPSLPNGWCYASPDQLTALHKNALTIGPFGSSLLKSDYTDSGVPLVFVRDIRSENFGGPETRYVSQAKADELASHIVRSGDLLVTKMGDPPGDTAIYPEGRPPAIITADCIKLTPHPDLVSAEYLRFAIRAYQIGRQFAEITLGVAQQKVSLGRFRSIAVPLPPLADQRRIVVRAAQLMALVDQLEAQLASSKATGEELTEAVVAELTASTRRG